MWQRQGVCGGGPRVGEAGPGRAGEGGWVVSGCRAVLHKPRGWFERQCQVRLDWDHPHPHPTSQPAPTPTPSATPFILGAPPLS